MTQKGLSPCLRFQQCLGMIPMSQQHMVLCCGGQLALRSGECVGQSVASVPVSSRSHTLSPHETGHCPSLGGTQGPLHPFGQKHANQKPAEGNSVGLLQTYVVLFLLAQGSRSCGWVIDLLQHCPALLE